ncbi:MAG: phage major capsid protein [Pseudomonadota bacterium]
MLESVKISRRQSEIRQSLAELAGKETPTEDEVRQMDEMDREYRSNETRYRASLIAEDTERREAGNEMETRSEQEWGELMAGFELRQVALALDEGRQLDGQTAEIVNELREQGGYRGVPVPWEALEVRAGETVSANLANPTQQAPIIDRLFADGMAMRMGGRMINVGVGDREIPVTNSNVTAGWAQSETGNVADPIPFTTIERMLEPDHTLGVQMKISRKALKQTGAALEQAVRRDMNGAMSVEIDRAVFLGTGANGEPTGIIPGAGGFGIASTAIDAEANYSRFVPVVTEFINANAAAGPGSVNLMLRSEVWASMDDQFFGGTAETHWDLLTKRMGSVQIATNALAAPTGDPATTTALMTTTARGVPPFMVGTWGAVDLIRDPYSDAASGGLRLTALATMDVTVSRSVQTHILTGIQ